MPRINLLPWREELRKERQKQFNVQAGAAAILGVLVWFWGHSTMQHFISFQDQRNEYLQNQIKTLDKQIAEIKSLQETKRRLIARMQIIEQLQQSRPEEVHLFDELVKTLPDGVYLTSVIQRGKNLEIQGIAESNARVATYMRNIDSSAWLGDPNLTVTQTDQKGKLRRSRFTITAKQVDKNAKKEDAAG